MGEMTPWVMRTAPDYSNLDLHSPQPPGDPKPPISPEKGVVRVARRLITNRQQRTAHRR